MKTSKVTVKAVKDKQIAEMFNQMLGAGGANVAICYPKYKDIKDCISKILEVLSLLNDSIMLRDCVDFENNRQEITQFIQRGKEDVGVLFSINFSEYEWNLNLVEDDDKKKFGECYETIKKHPLINVLISMCDALIVYKKHIGDSENLNYKFILKMAGTDFSPLPFSKLNFKHMFNLMEAVPKYNNESVKKFILLVLNKLYTLSYRLYKIISSPDINVDEFVNVIMSNLDQVKKQIPRCDKAFKKIEESVGLLKTNFDQYHKDFISSKNPTIIMEHFVIDVSKNTRADPQTTVQFRKIIQFYQKAAKNQINDPRVRYLFDKVNEQFNELDKHSNLSKNVDVMASDDEESDDKESAGNIVNTDSVPIVSISSIDERPIDDLVDAINGTTSTKGRGDHKHRRR